MKIQDYVKYLKKRHDALQNKDTTVLQDSTLNFLSYLNEEQSTPEMRSINVVKTALYLIDMDLEKMLPSLYRKFVDSFKLPGIMPGGKNCMMNLVCDSSIFDF